MNRIYLLHWRGEHVCYVVAPTPGRAKSLAMKCSEKAQKADFVSLDCRLAPAPWEVDLSTPSYLFDVETHNDVMEQELSDWYADQ